MFFIFYTFFLHIIGTAGTRTIYAICINAQL